MKEKIYQLLNEQLNAELFSACVYQNMAAKADADGMHGFSKWLYIQYLEELGHVELIYNYISERNHMPKLKKMDQDPSIESKNVLDIPHEALKLEKEITKKINNIIAHALELHDYATANFLEEIFIKEQVEEIDLFYKLIDKFNLAKSGGMYILDEELGKRQKEKI